MSAGGDGGEVAHAPPVEGGEVAPAPPVDGGEVAAPAVDVAAPQEATEPSAAPDAPDAAQALAAFYDRRAPAALAYCARLCEPEAIADAVEEAFGHVFTTAAAGGAPPAEEDLDRLLRDALVTAAAARRGPAPDAPEHPARRQEEAHRAYDALSGDDAPALGRSLLGEIIEAQPAEQSPLTAPAAPVAETAEADEAARATDAEPVARRTRRRRLPGRNITPGWRRRLVVVLTVIGVLLLAEAVVTLAWKEPFTNYLAAQAQDDLGRQLDRLDRQSPALGASDQRRLAAIHDAGARSRKRMSLLAARLDASVADGEALGRIQIGKIGIDYVFVQGTDAATLRKGPGHYHGDTTLPGEGGVVGIAGHRTTYAAPFRDIDSLHAGDRITLRMPYGRFTYAVTGHRIVPADYGRAFAGGGGTTGGERLVLSACHPLYSATERILVDARLVASEPLGSAIETSVPALPAASPRVLARSRTAARLKALGSRQLGPGMSGPDVRELQRLLGMPVTGTFDANTSAAVLAFQAAHGLPQVGRAGSQTKHALARRSHPPARPPTPAAVPQQRPPNPSATGGGTYTGPTSTTPSHAQPSTGTRR
jgi:sortase A